MAEYQIQVNDGLTAEIDSLRDAGKDIDGSVSTEGDSTLPAAVEYRQRCRKVAEIMRLYSGLIQHDTKQLDAFVKTIRAADN